MGPEVTGGTARYSEAKRGTARLAAGRDIGGHVIDDCSHRCSR